MATAKAVNGRMRMVALAIAVAIGAGEFLRCALVLSIPDGAASTVAGVLVLFGSPFFLGVAIRHWALAILGGIAGLYVLVWMCHMISSLPMFPEPPLGLALMVLYPVGWVAMAAGWLGSRVHWTLQMRAKVRG